MRRPTKLCPRLLRRTDGMKSCAEQGGTWAAPGGLLPGQPGVCGGGEAEAGGVEPGPAPPLALQRLVTVGHGARAPAAQPVRRLAAPLQPRHGRRGQLGLGGPHPAPGLHRLLLGHHVSHWVCLGITLHVGWQSNSEKCQAACHSDLTSASDWFLSTAGWLVSNSQRKAKANEAFDTFKVKLSKSLFKKVIFQRVAGVGRMCLPAPVCLTSAASV